MSIILQALVTTSALLSLMGSALSIFSYFRFRELKSQRSRLVLFLSISDLGESIGWLLYNFIRHNMGVCMAQAVLLQFFVASTVFWTMNLSIHSFLTSRKFLKYPQNSLDTFHQIRFEIGYHMIGWGIAAILLSYGLSNDLIGFSGDGYWCWLSAPESTTMSAMYLIWAEVFIAVALAAILYALTRIQLKRSRLHRRSFIAHKVSYRHENDSSHSDSLSQSLSAEEDHPQNALLDSSNQESIAGLHVWLYALVTVIAYFPAATNRMYTEAHGYSIDALMYLHAFCKPLQGFLDFLVYGLSEKMHAPKNFTEAVNNHTCVIFFKKFLASTFCTENMDFYESCTRLVEYLSAWSGEELKLDSISLGGGDQPQPQRKSTLALPTISERDQMFRGRVFSIGLQSRRLTCANQRTFPEIMDILKDLVTDYILRDGRYPLNLSSRQVSTSLENWSKLKTKFPFLESPGKTPRDCDLNMDIQKRIEFLEGVKSVLRGPLGVVFESLELDSFQKFQQSSIYFDMINALKVSENLESRPLIVEIFWWFTDLSSRLFSKKDPRASSM